MSIYHQLFETNPFSTLLLHLVGVTEQEIHSYRDCYLEDGIVVVFTHGDTALGRLCMINGYIGSAPDTDYPVYSKFYFSLPEHQAVLDLWAKHGATITPQDRWREFNLACRAHNVDAPVLQRAMRVLNPVLQAALREQRALNQSRLVAG